VKYLINIILFFALKIVTLSAQAGNTANSQSEVNATLTGKVIDKETNSPLEAATVSVTDRGTGNVLTGTITNSDGEFKISIPMGVYNIDVTYISYEKSSVESVDVSGGNLDVKLGTISLSPSGISLNEVKVVSEKPVIENHTDKIVYNVASDITSQGALTIDILRKVPQVTVDAEGNVELQGNANVRFLINGKTSSIFGNNLADALASIPASQIKSIEAITNPGAKYDLQGSGGIINIILQENKLQGVSGNVNLSAGTRNENGSVNIGIKRGTFGVNGYLSGNYRLPSDGTFTSVRVTTDTLSGLNTSLLQDGYNRYERNGYRAGAGFEWDITKKISLSGSAGYNSFTFNGSGLTTQNEMIADAEGSLISDISTVRNYINSRESGSLDLNLDFKKRFSKEGHELGLAIYSTYGRPVSYYLQTRSPIDDSNPINGSESNNPGTDNSTIISADYIYPLSETSRFEAGVKGTFQDITSLAGVNEYDPLTGEFIFDPLQSYDLGYTLDIYAAYLSFSFSMFKWLDLKTGSRYEYSDVGIDYADASVPSYGTFVPSIALSHNFGKNKSIQLSYNRRIRRPDYNDLNPFINMSDPYNIQTGNILLKPETGDRIELSFNTGFRKGGSLRITLSQRIDMDEIEDITRFYPEYTINDSIYRNVSVTTNENIGTEYATGLNLFSSIPVTSKLSLRGNMMLFHNYVRVEQSEDLISTGFRFRGNLNATWQLPRKLVVEAFGFYRSGGKDIQGKEPHFYIYNFAFRKLLWGGNGSFGLTATNVFSRDIKQVSTTATGNSASKSVRMLPFRSFGVSFTYKFGKMQQKNQDRGDESESIGGGGD